MIDTYRIVLKSCHGSSFSFLPSYSACKISTIVILEKLRVIFLLFEIRTCVLFLEIRFLTVASAFGSVSVSSLWPKNDTTVKLESNC